MAEKESVDSESLAKSREQRKNAGNKMSKLLADELGDDDFYKTALGGFEDESDDEEYMSEDEQSDQVDSDFSLSETEEIVEQDEDENKKRKKMKRIFKSKHSVNERGDKQQAKKANKERKSTTSTTGGKKSPVELRTSSRKSTRAATVRSADKERKRIEKKQVEKKQVTFSQLRPLTQKELLAEAEVTEKINIASLKAYQQMEETKKKAKNLKPVRKEPMIRYLSLSMPMIETINEIKVDVDDDIKEDQMDVIETMTKAPLVKCSRNFIIFTDPKTFPGNYFTRGNKVTVPQKAYCPVTGLPAKYKDPVTGLPYATAQAFRYIRDHYAKKTTEDCNSIKTCDGRLRSSQRLTKQTYMEA